ncbi:hypothetical protein DFH11DRAFT_1543302 [Phellopilus nigrolimitatus]|nr:hypothetical protein DFH11DRAFT_1543302 [Phellopilus nigrolimitatus]
MPAPTHLPHALYALALTSLALHLHTTRKAAQEQRAAAAARISVLAGLAARLRAGERVPADELARARRLVRPGGDVADGRDEARSAEATERDVGWRAVVLGRKGGDAAASRGVGGEERVQGEWDAAVQKVA